MPRIALRLLLKISSALANEFFKPGSSVFLGVDDISLSCSFLVLQVGTAQLLCHLFYLLAFLFLISLV